MEVFRQLSSGGSDLSGSGVESVLDAVAENRQNRDHHEGDEGDEETVFDESLAFFFLEKTLDHLCCTSLKRLEVSEFGISRRCRSLMSLLFNRAEMLCSNEVATEKISRFRPLF